MTKKDYELIAKVIKGRLSNAQSLEKFGYSQKEINMATTVIRDTADFMASELSRENTKFNIARFRTACGLDTGCEVCGFKQTCNKCQIK